MAVNRYNDTRSWYAVSTYSGYEDKVADSINDSSLVKINKTDNTNNVIHQNYNISIFSGLNVEDTIKNAMFLGNKNAQLVSEDLEKLFKEKFYPD